MKLVYCDHVYCVAVAGTASVQEGRVLFGKIPAHPGWLYLFRKGDCRSEGELRQLLAVPPRHLGRILSRKFSLCIPLFAEVGWVLGQE